MLVTLLSVPISLAAQIVPDADRPQDRQAVALAQSGRLDEALALLQRVLIDDRTQLGWHHPITLRTTENLANVLDMSGQPAKAVPFHRFVLQSHRTARGAEDEATLRAMNNLGQTLDTLGQFTEAIALLEQSVAGTLETAGPNAPMTLSRMNNLAVAYGRSGDAPRALDVQRDLVARGARVLGADHPNVLRWSTSLARLLDMNGFYAQAEAMHQTVIAGLSRVHGAGSRDVLRATQNFAGALMEQNRLQDAEPLFRTTLDGHESLLGPLHPATMTSRLLLGNLLSRMGRGDETLALRTRDLDLLSSALGPDHPYALDALGRYATTLSDLGRHDQAKTLMERRLQTSMQAFGPEGQGTLMAMNDLAVLFLETGQHEAALPLMQAAHSGFLATLGGRHPFTLNAALNLSAMLSNVGQSLAAIALLEETLRTIRAAPGTPPDIEIRLQVNLAAMVEDAGQPGRAVSLLSAVIDQAEGMYGEQSPRVMEFKSALASALLADGEPGPALAVAREAYAFQRDRLAGTGQLSEEQQRLALEAAAQISWVLVNAAWQVSTEASEQDRAALRAEAFEAAQVIGHGPSAFAIARASGQIAGRKTGIAPLLTELENRNRELRAFEVSVSRLAEEGRLSGAVASERLQALANVAESAAESLRTAFPAFFELINPESVPLARLTGSESALLHEDQALILFLPGTGSTVSSQPITSDGFVWAVTRTGAAWARIEGDERALAEMIAGLRNEVDPVQWTVASLRAPISPQEDVGQAVHGFDLDRANALYRALFGNAEIARLIADKPRWIIAPQGPLLSLPFGALVTSLGPEGAPKPAEINWLGTERALSILPSLQLLDRPASSSELGASTIAEANYIGFGDPVFSGKPGRLRTADISLGPSVEQRLSAVRRLPRLPGTRDEVLAVAETFHDTGRAVFLDADANERRLMALNSSGDLREAGVVHFATHGLIANEIVGLAEPALVLTPPSAAMTEDWDDGLLTASEVAQLSLDAEWVVLSACNTAAGEGPGADGLSGLARAFLYAGARGMLVTHWAVQDDLAAQLTTQVMSATGRGVPRSVALRDALRDVLADGDGVVEHRARAHPSIWAAFQIVGTDG
ncbi:tetratricopeptide repeat protein [Roseobacter sp. A03A-229]